MLSRQSDERLVDLTRAGNTAAFEAIVRRYRRELMRYCCRLLSPSRAEDAVQQTILNAHAALMSGSAELSLRPWLYRIAHNQAVSMLRQNGWDDDPLTEAAEGLSETPQAAHERRHDLSEALRAVRGLPERQRDALVWRELEGRSYDDIASHLGVSGGAARQLVLRARSSLRAGVSALTPPGLLMRLFDGTNATAGGASLGGVAAAGGGATLAKTGVAAVVAVFVAGGVTGAVLKQVEDKDIAVAQATPAADPSRAAGTGALPAATSNPTQSDPATDRQRRVRERRVLRRAERAAALADARRSRTVGADAGEDGVTPSGDDTRSPAGTAPVGTDPVDEDDRGGAGGDDVADDSDGDSDGDSADGETADVEAEDPDEDQDDSDDDDSPTTEEAGGGEENSGNDAAGADDDD